MLIITDIMIERVRDDLARNGSTTVELRMARDERYQHSVNFPDDPNPKRVFQRRQVELVQGNLWVDGSTGAKNILGVMESVKKALSAAIVEENHSLVDMNKILEKEKAALAAQTVFAITKRNTAISDYEKQLHDLPLWGKLRLLFKKV